MISFTLPQTLSVNLIQRRVCSFIIFRYIFVFLCTIYQPFAAVRSISCSGRPVLSIMFVIQFFHKPIWSRPPYKALCKTIQQNVMPGHDHKTTSLHWLIISNRSSWCPTSVVTMIRTNPKYIHIYKVIGFMFRVWHLEQPPQALNCSRMPEFSS